MSKQNKQNSQTEQRDESIEKINQVFKNAILNTKQEREKNKQTMRLLIERMEFKRAILAVRVRHGITPQGEEVTKQSRNAENGWTPMTTYSNDFLDDIWSLVHKFNLPDCFFDAISHYVQYNEIGHIQNDLEITIDFTKGNRVSFSSQGKSSKNEGITGHKLKNALIEFFSPQKMERYKPTLGATLQFRSSSPDQLRSSTPDNSSPDEDRRMLDKNRKRQERLRKRLE